MGDWTQNPFAQSDNDPFNDPSVKSASVGKVGEYNPFEGGGATQEPASSSTKDVIAQGAASFSSKGSKSAAAASAPAAPPPAAPAAPAVEPNQTPDWASKPPAKSASTSSKAAAKAAPAPVPAAAKVQELESAEEVLRRREYELREHQAKAMMPRSPKADPTHRPSNWPPFPPKCPTPFRPCFHQDFPGEIPSYAFRISKEAYYLWMVVGVAYMWNFIVCLAALDTSATGSSQAAGISCAYMVIGTPCAYCCWFHYLYNAFRLDSSMKYGWWFFVTGMHMLFSVFMALGFPSTGAGGFWVATAVINDYKIVGIMLYSNAILWSGIVLWTLWLCKRVLSVYRNTGGSMEKARGQLHAAGQQAMYDAISSDAGQAAVRSAATSAAQSAWPPKGEAEA